MTRLIWGGSGLALYAAGVDHGVLYPQVGPGVSWSGLTAVDETPSESTQHITYVDGQKLTTQLQLGSYFAKISAVTYPREFEAYDGYGEMQTTAQDRKAFNLSYRTLLNNSDSLLSGYKIHLVYNAQVSPTTKTNSTLSSSSAALEFSWDLSTLPIYIPGANPASHVVIDSTKVYPETLALVESMLYGDNASLPRIPTMTELLQIFEASAVLKITDLGDGSWTAEGPDSAITMLDPTTFQIAWPSAVYVDTESYSIRSL